MASDMDIVSFLQSEVGINAAIMGIVACLALYQVMFWDKRNQADPPRRDESMETSMGRSGSYFTVAIAMFTLIVSLFPIFAESFGVGQPKTDLYGWIKQWIPLKPTSLIGILALMLGGALWYNYQRSFMTNPTPTQTAEDAENPLRGMLYRLQWPTILFLGVIGTMAVASYLQKVVRNFIPEGGDSSSKFLGIRNLISLATTLAPVLFLTVAQYFTNRVTQKLAKGYSQDPKVGIIMGDPKASKAAHASKALLYLLMAIVVLQVIVTGLATFNYNFPLITLFSKIGNVTSLGRQ